MSQSDPVYLMAGDFWKTYQGAEVTQLPGASYDLASNTLTLENFSGQMLDINLMGNGFTINLVGDNYLEYIMVWGWNYGGSLTITGDGSLTVNKDNINDVGIEMNGEGSKTCLMVDSNATLDVSGSLMAIYIYNSTMDKTIYYLRPVTLTGGTRGNGEIVVNSEGQNYLLKGYNVVDDTGRPATHVIFKP